MDALVQHISQTYAIPPALARILVQKGVTTPDLARATFEPALNHLVSWQTLPDIQALLEAVDRAHRRHERILVWGHEDADGFTSVAVVLAALRRIGLDPLYYVPSKRLEGHGLGEKGLAYARDQGVTLLLTVDCCSSDRDAVFQARSLGFQVVLTDHHELPRTLPEAPLVNPKRGGGSFPYLAGVGVALKVAWAILDAFQGLSLEAYREQFPWSFAYAAIGTVADRVPLFAENRILTDEGLQALQETPPPFVETLKTDLGQTPALDLLISVVSSGKRLNHHHAGVEVLVRREPEALKPLLKALLQGVQEYRTHGDALLSRAMQEIRTGRRYLLIDLQDAEPQYLGYVASRLKDLYGVPTVVLGRKQQDIVAEVRAPYGFNSLEMLHALSPLFKNYGGHKAASGFTMAPENLASLVEEMELYFRSYRPRLEDQVDLKEETLTPELWDGILRLARLGVDLRVLTRYRSDLMGPQGGSRIPEGHWVLISTGPQGIQISEVTGLEEA